VARRRCSPWHCWPLHRTGRRPPVGVPFPGGAYAGDAGMTQSRGVAVRHITCVEPCIASLLCMMRRDAHDTMPDDKQGEWVCPHTVRE